MVGSSEVRVWIVGKVDGDNFREWEFQGIFASEEGAVAACESELYFVAPAVVDERLPDQSVEWPGAYYPLAGAFASNVAALEIQREEMDAIK
jgi:hypothetical protein